MAKKWIASAISRPGALIRKAKAAGMDTQAFAQAHKGDTGRTGKQARLAVTLSKMHGKSAHGSGPMKPGELRQGYRQAPMGQRQPAAAPPAVGAPQGQPQRRALQAPPSLGSPTPMAAPAAHSYGPQHHKGAAHGGMSIGDVQQGYKRL